MNRREFILGAAAGVISPVFAADDGGLRLRFLGTGAADWDGPDERGERRRLSSVLIDNCTVIDFTKTAEDMLPAGVRPDTILYTHSHDDHYDPAAALRAGVRRVFAHESWADGARAEFARAAQEMNVAAPSVTALAFGETVAVGGVLYTCVPANHATARKGEHTAMYLLECGAERILYATDTGGVTAEAARIVGIDAHVHPGRPITALIMEATMGVDYADDFRIYTHSSVATVAQLVRVLTQTKRYLPPPGRKVYLTHMAKTLHGSQAEVAAAVPSPLAPAYDGLELVFGRG